MSAGEGDLGEQLATAYGIDLDYLDATGVRRQVPRATLTTLLEAIGVVAGSDAERRAALAARQEHAWRRTLDPVAVVAAGEPAAVDARILEQAAPRPLRWELHREDGSVSAGELRAADLTVEERGRRDGAAIAKHRLPLPGALPAGYHRLLLHGAEAGDEPAELSLIAAPEQCYEPPAVAHGDRLWGIAAQLYALRSRANWGIGDFSDLGQLADLCGRLGASLIGLNPLHALFPGNPPHISPYSASSRLFLNVWYIDVTAVPDFAEAPAARALASGAALRAGIERARSAELVLYDEVCRAKLAVLERCHAHFREHHVPRGSARASELASFAARGGEALRRHALFDALHEQMIVERGIWDWPSWPAEYRDPESPAVARFAAEHAARVDLFVYLQWQARVQLEAAAARCQASGLAVGLYRDLAVSVERAAADAWGDQPSFALDVSIGAPPDPLAPQGQSWGVVPWIPDRLRAAGYQPFIDTLRANMCCAGALRLDHVMGLMRLFWVPRGMGPAAGAYVRYPLQDLLGIVALESQRNRCLVIGEDLGTVPRGFRETLAQRKLYSYRLLYFERDGDGAFKPAAEFPRQALVAASTHDLPTVTGFWSGRDLELRDELGLYPTSEVRRRLRAEREQDRGKLLRRLDAEGLLPASVARDPAQVPSMPPELVRALHIHLARSPATLLLVQPEDLLGAVEQNNLPGTVDQHPNWRRRLAAPLEELAEHPEVVATAAALRPTRGQRAG